MGICACGGWGIDPADMAIGAAVNNIDAAIGGMTKDEYRSARHVEFHHGVANRQLSQTCRRFGDDNRREAVEFRLALRLRRGDDVACRRGAMIVAPLGAVVLEPAMITTQPFLDP